MSTSRTWGLGLLAVSAVLWVVVVLAVVTTPARNGANIGAGMLFLLAVPCTVTGIVLSVTGRAAPVALSPAAPDAWSSPRGGTAHQAADRGNAVAGWALGVGIAGLALPFVPVGSATALLVVAAAASAFCATAVVLGRRERRRARVDRGASTGMAVAAIIVGTIGLCFGVLQLVEIAVALAVQR